MKIYKKKKSSHKDIRRRRQKLLKYNLHKKVFELNFNKQAQCTMNHKDKCLKKKAMKNLV